jgi:hypothetical protein
MCSALHTNISGRIAMVKLSLTFSRNCIRGNHLTYTAIGVTVPPGAGYDIESIMHYPKCTAIKLSEEYLKALIQEVYNGDASKVSVFNDLVGQREDAQLL